ncbi:Pentatricopeptide repeat [Dillenia turbinata]|uniref:Pentatricopeptide repeat n=1 Tax=Dillenia turbinata TaxID=194707 RepID=A0AAN8UH53_9MAGN
MGEIRNAEKLFSEIPVKNVVSWSVVILGYAKNGFGGKSLELFREMRVLGLEPNTYTIVGVLVGVGGLGDLMLAHCVHGLIVKSGLEFESFVGTALLDAYAKCESVVDSCKLFDQMEKSLVSSNAVLAGFAYNDCFEEVVLLFNQLRMAGLVPDGTTLITLMQGCVALQSQALCRPIHNLVLKLGLVSDTFVCNSLLDMYSSFLDLDAAMMIFDAMEYKDTFSWTIMMGLLLQFELAHDVMKLFCLMRADGIYFDAVVLINLISASAILGDLKHGRQLHAQSIICGFGSYLNLANSIITMYSKCGDMDTSRSVFDRITGKSLVSWTAIVSGYLQNGQPREALDLLLEFREQGIHAIDSVSLVSFLSACGDLALLKLCQQLHCYAFSAGFSLDRSVQNCLISTYSKCGNVQLASNVFKEMGYLQDVVSWNAILNGYGINGRGETAVSLYHEMKKRGKVPDSATYLCILSACSHSGLIDDGLRILSEVVEGNRIEVTEDHYGCFIDMLARAGHLLEAWRFMDGLSERVGSHVWRAILNWCVHHNEMALAELVASKISDQDPNESDHAVLLSNVQASLGNFQDVEALRSGMKKNSKDALNWQHVLLALEYGAGEHYLCDLNLQGIVRFPSFQFEVTGRTLNVGSLHDNII